MPTADRAPMSRGGRQVSAMSPLAPLYVAPPLPPSPPCLRADQLNAQQKRQLWAYMQEHDPARVEWFKDDNVKQLLGQGAVAVFDVDYLNRAGVRI